MATVAGIKIKTKAPREKRIAFADEKYTGPEPEWTEDAKDWETAKFDSKLRKSFNYYNYHYSQKDCKKYVVEWMQKTNEFSKIEIKAFIRSSDKAINMTACGLIMANRQGMPLKQRHIEFLHKSVQDAIASAEPEVIDEIKTPEQAYKTPTIQDRMNEKTSELIGELEGSYDDMESVKFYDWFTKNNVIQSQLSKYEALFSKRKAELELAQSKKDAQVTEGYSHYKATDFKKRIAWLEQLLAAVEQYRGVKKATKKARVKKAPSKEKLVAKLKYAKTDTALKIVSINPADIIGAQTLWVYNTKTRKLGRYVAAAYRQLSIKGTSIEGFDTDKSISKTLRKPDEKLKEFAKAGKVQLRKFLDEIKATEAKLNGRISADIVLLRTE
jgi:hypothetical protein